MFDFYKYLFLFMINLSLAISSCNEFAKSGVYKLNEVFLDQEKYLNIRLEVDTPAIKLPVDSMNNSEIYSIKARFFIGKIVIDYEFCSDLQVKDGLKILLVSDDKEHEFSLNISTSKIINYQEYDQKDLLLPDQATSVGTQSSEAKQSTPIKYLNFTDIPSTFTLDDRTIIDLDKWAPIERTISQLVKYKLNFFGGQEKIGYGVLYDDSLFIFLLDDLLVSKYILEGKLYFNQQNFMLRNFINITSKGSVHEVKKITLLNYGTVKDLLKFDTSNIKNLLLFPQQIKDIINNTGKTNIADTYFLVFGDVKKHFVGIKNFRKPNVLSLLLKDSGRSVHLVLETEVTNDLIKIGMIVLICRDSTSIKNCFFLGEVTNINIVNDRLLIKVNYLTRNIISHYTEGYRAEVTLDSGGDSRVFSSQDYSETPSSSKRLKMDK